MAAMATFGRRDISPDAAAMLQAIHQQQPYLLWLQWANTMQDPGRRGQVRNALQLFGGMVQAQLHHGGNVVIEGKSCDIPVRDELFSSCLGQVLQLPTTIHWCGLGIHGGLDDHTLLCGEHLVMSKKKLTEMPCVRRRRSLPCSSTSGPVCEQLCVEM